MKIIGKILEDRMRKKVEIDCGKFGLWSRRSVSNAIQSCCILGERQQKHYHKKAFSAFGTTTKKLSLHLALPQKSFYCIWHSWKGSWSSTKESFRNPVLWGSVLGDRATRIFVKLDVVTGQQNKPTPYCSQKHPTQRSVLPMIIVFCNQLLFVKQLVCNILTPRKVNLLYDKQIDDCSLGLTTNLFKQENKQVLIINNGAFHKGQFCVTEKLEHFSFRQQKFLEKMFIPISNLLHSLTQTLLAILP